MTEEERGEGSERDLNRVIALSVLAGLVSGLIIGAVAGAQSQQPVFQDYTDEVMVENLGGDTEVRIYDVQDGELTSRETTFYSGSRFVFRPEHPPQYHLDPEDADNVNESLGDNQ